MMNFDRYKLLNIHNKNPSKIHNFSRMFIFGGTGSGKTNSLFNLISHQPGIDKIYLYAKDPYEAKYQLLINKTENTH